MFCRKMWTICLFALCRVFWVILLCTGNKWTWIFVVFISLIVLSWLCMWYFSVDCPRIWIDRGWNRNATENNQSHLLPCVVCPCAQKCETFDNKFTYKTFVFQGVVFVWFVSFQIEFKERALLRSSWCLSETKAKT